MNERRPAALVDYPSINLTNFDRKWFADLGEKVPCPNTRSCALLLGRIVKHDEALDVLSAIVQDIGRCEDVGERRTLLAQFESLLDLFRRER